MMNLDILEDEQKRKAEENKIPMHRIGEPNEIAKVALFFGLRRRELHHWYNNLCRRRTDTSNLIHSLFMLRRSASLSSLCLYPLILDL
jgi:hypothetical protein